MAITIPTWLTIFRILTIPVMVATFYWDHPKSHYITTTVFVLGALTDILDGWVARRCAACYRHDSAAPWRCWRPSS